jgi:hypothetical protein
MCSKTLEFLKSLEPRSFAEEFFPRPSIPSYRCSWTFSKFLGPTRNFPVYRRYKFISFEAYGFSRRPCLVILWYVAGNEKFSDLTHWGMCDGQILSCLDPERWELDLDCVIWRNVGFCKSCFTSISFLHVSTFYGRPHITPNVFEPHTTYWIFKIWRDSP